MTTLPNLKRPLRIGIDARLWSETGVGRYIRNLTKYIAQADMQNQYYLFLRKEQFDTVESPGINFLNVLQIFNGNSLEEQVLFPAVLP